MTATAPQPMSKKRIVYSVPEMSDVAITRDRRYTGTDSEPLTMDLYHPPRTSAERLPAVLFATGFADPGARQMLGCTFKEMGAFVSWAELVAASGLVAVTYENRDPARDARSALDFIRQNAASLGVDEKRVAVWSCSAHVATALSLLMQTAPDPHPACAVLLYGYMLDDDGKTGVGDAAARLRFATPCAGRSVADLARDIPMFIVRAGRDEMPGLNASIDDFVGKAVPANLPLTFVNYPDAPHAFDLMYDTPTSRNVIKQVVRFLQSNLVR